jgi:pre-mRNA-processing factor 39
MYIFILYVDEPTVNGEPKEDRTSSPEQGGEKSEQKRKTLPELGKYWKAVKEDSSDFTGWTYLLQYVDQEVSKPYFKGIEWC